MVLSSQKNLYEVLELSISAQQTEIKASYRRLARKYHPDLNQGKPEFIIKFKEITEAYEILSDKAKKKDYDILNGYYYKNTYSNYKKADSAYKKTTSDFTTKPSKENKSKTDSFSNIFNDIFDGLKKTTPSTKSHKTNQPKSENGSNVETTVLISLKEAITGTSRTINILHVQLCPKCQARPFLNGAKCPVCNGRGEVSIHKKINVKIPAGIKSGSKIRIANEGNKGYNGGRNGDLYLTVKIENNHFTFDGLNALCTVPITPFEAVLGATIEVQALSGSVKMKITPNTQSGQKLRLAGQGLTQNGKTGDMIVTVMIEVPKNPSKEEKELYEKLKNISRNNVREI